MEKQKVTGYNYSKSDIEVETFDVERAKCNSVAGVKLCKRSIKLEIMLQNILAVHAKYLI